MQSLLLFPTQVFHGDLLDYEELNNNLLSSIALLQITDPGVQKSNIKGWHSDDKILLHHPDFTLLRELILAAAQEVLKDLKWNIPLSMDNCWVTVSPNGASNSIHSHPGSLLSGVYYLQAPDQASPLILHDPRQAKVHGNPQGQAINPNTADKISLEPKAGRLFMFPGWLQHSVPENLAQEDRIVFSFNLTVGY